MATIMDVAKCAGVSMKTVSRVLNNEAHVRPNMRDKVLRAVSELDYRPNLAARQLAGNRSFLISLITHEFTTSYFSALMVAAAAQCRQQGYHLVSETCDIDESRAVVVQRITDRLRPDGIILAPPLCNDPAIVRAIAATGTPLVRIAGVALDAAGDHGTTLPVRDRAVSRELVEHLLQQKHRRIAMIAPPPEHGGALERVFGYREALAGAGIDCDPDLVVAGDFSFASGAHCAERLFELSRPPTAIFAANDGMALGAMAVARQRNMLIPKDVAIAGFDDSPGSRMVFPPLTTVRQPMFDIGRAAVLTLLGLQQEEPELEHRLIVRGSTTGDTSLVLIGIDA